MVQYYDNWKTATAHFPSSLNYVAWKTFLRMSRTPSGGGTPRFATPPLHKSSSRVALQFAYSYYLGLGGKDNNFMDRRGIRLTDLGR